MHKPTSHNSPKILFLNQMAGPLFRELAEDLAKERKPSVLYTGHPDTLKHPSTPQLQIKKAPSYNRRNELTRVLSWFLYFLTALFQVSKTPGALLFFVSNPPFLGLIGFLFKKIRRQAYVVLVYDIHPDILVNMGRLRKNGIIARTWRRMNRLIYENADAVFTLGDYMAANLTKQFAVHKTKAGQVLVVPPWVDTEFIKPLPKTENWFARKHHQLDKVTILYSGNLGATHNIESILEMARELQHERDIHFLIIGEGAKWTLVEDSIKQEQLKNITLLPFQPEDVLPYSMATGDIAIVSMEPGTEGLMIPSKAFYYLAAGCYLHFTGSENSEIAALCKEHKCGHISSKDDGFNFTESAKTRQSASNNATRLVRKYYSRTPNTTQLIKLLKKLEI